MFPHDVPAGLLVEGCHIAFCQASGIVYRTIENFVVRHVAVYVVVGLIVIVSCRVRKYYRAKLNEAP